MKRIENKIRKVLDNSRTDLRDYSFTENFIKIITRNASGYSNDKLKGFLRDMQYGCQSGMIGEFVYNYDCKKFYIRHIDDLEQYKLDMENNMGCAIQNTKQLFHYTFMCWLCFEEFCYSIYNEIYE